MGKVQEGRTLDSERKTDRGRIARHIDKLVKKLGTKARTTVYHSLDELPEGDREYIEQRHRQGRPYTLLLQ